MPGWDNPSGTPDDESDERARFVIDVFPDLTPGDVHHQLLSDIVTEVGSHPTGCAFWCALKELGAGYVLVERPQDPRADEGPSDDIVCVERDGDRFLPVFTSVAAVDEYRATDPGSWSGRGGLPAMPIWAPAALSMATDDGFDGVAVVADSGVCLPLRNESLAIGLPRYATNEEAKCLMAMDLTDDSLGAALAEALFRRPLFTFALSDNLSPDPTVYKTPVMVLEDGRQALVLGTSPAELLAHSPSSTTIVPELFGDLAKHVLTLDYIEVIVVNPLGRSIGLPVSMFREARAAALAEHEGEGGAALADDGENESTDDDTGGAGGAAGE